MENANKKKVFGDRYEVNREHFKMKTLDVLRKSPVAVKRTDKIQCHEVKTD